MYDYYTTPSMRKKRETDYCVWHNQKYASYLVKPVASNVSTPMPGAATPMADVTTPGAPSPAFRAAASDAKRDAAAAAVSAKEGDSYSGSFDINDALNNQPGAPFPIVTLTAATASSSSTAVNLTAAGAAAAGGGGGGDAYSMSADVLAVMGGAAPTRQPLETNEAEGFVNVSAPPAQAMSEEEDLPA